MNDYYGKLTLFQIVSTAIGMILAIIAIVNVSAKNGIGQFILITCVSFGLILILVAIFSIIRNFIPTKRPFKVLSFDKHVVIKDALGTNASIILELKILIRDKRQKVFSFRNINIPVKGSIDNWNASHPKKIGTIAGNYKVILDLPKDIKNYSIHDIWLSYDVHDTFTEKEKEYTIILVSYETVKASVEISLPSDHPCIDALAIEYEGTSEQILNKPIIKENGRSIKWESKKLKKLRIGNEYRIEWGW